MMKQKIIACLASKSRAVSSNEAGATLLEVLVSLAILGIIAAVLLSGLATTAKASLTVDEQASAESLARSQMEYAKTVSYVYEATEYTAAPVLPGEDYTAYFVSIDAAPLNSPDDGIQKITVTVEHHGEGVITLEGYKVNR